MHDKQKDGQGPWIEIYFRESKRYVDLEALVLKYRSECLINQQKMQPDLLDDGNYEEIRDSGSFACADNKDVSWRRPSLNAYETTDYSARTQLDCFSRLGI